MWITIFSRKAMRNGTGDGLFSSGYRANGTSASAYIIDARMLGARLQITAGDHTQQNAARPVRGPGGVDGAEGYPRARSGRVDQYT
ncbi:hypothetical protein F1640_21940 [Novosphingobium sp. NBM11]|nr:hypothetical protein [Novosphingobium sp. NBM11]